MKKTEQFVITINRELGSGGRTIGEKLAKHLGVNFYDKAVIKALTAEFHLTTEEIETLKGNKGNWWSDFQRRVIPFYDTAKAEFYKVYTQDDPELITTDDIFKAEKEIVQEIGYGESCVIAGRSVTSRRWTSGVITTSRNMPTHRATTPATTTWSSTWLI